MIRNFKKPGAKLRGPRNYRQNPLTTACCKPLKDKKN